MELQPFAGPWLIGDAVISHAVRLMLTGLTREIAYLLNVPNALDVPLAPQSSRVDWRPAYAIWLDLSPVSTLRCC